MLKPRTPVAYLSLSLLFSFSVLAFFLHRAHPEILHRVPEVLRQQGLLGSTKAPKTPPGEAWAFATFLAGPTRTEQEEGEAGEDGYFVSTRVLIYQLLHSETARVNHASGNGAPIPFLVLVTEAVSQRKRKRLEKDGAVVVPVPPLEGEIVEGMAVTNPRYKDNLIKLRLAEMGDYDKICFIDADHLVTAPLSDIFLDPATSPQQTLSNPSHLKSDEAPLPETYTFAARPDTFGYVHPIPPLEPEPTYLNGGFFVLAPSATLFDYYTSLIPIPDRFDPSFMEQNLLNYAHRPEGNMPWMHLEERWNVNWPTVKDWEVGVRSFHAKYWDGDPTHDEVLKGIWGRQRAEMEGFWRGREGRG